MSAITLFLCGDVMPGRGVDQILGEPCAPRLYELLVKDAREYLAIAEHASGPIPRKVAPTYPWGVALEELERRGPAARIVNLETSVTTSEDAAPKGINYRMHPANIALLTSAHIDCAVLSNNHVLDWGRAGLLETLATVCQAGIQVTGAGRTMIDAQAPATIGVGRNGRVFVLGVCGPDCGVPRNWRATATEPGVFRVDDYSSASVDRIGQIIEGLKHSGDIAVVSVHWGGNWGYEAPDVHRHFAHALIERAAVDIVHGHSSHHAKGIEMYRRRPIFYGCGDFLNDYEGIHGPDGFRDDLTFMYFPTIELSTGELQRLEMVPLRIRRFQLQHASTGDRTWLRDTMARECGRFGHHVVAREDVLALEWT